MFKKFPVACYEKSNVSILALRQIILNHLQNVDGIRMTYTNISKPLLYIYCLHVPVYTSKYAVDGSYQDSYFLTFEYHYSMVIIITAPSKIV